MSARTLDELAQHVGHAIECVRYGPPDDPASIAIECDSCGTVLIDLEPGQFLATEDLLAVDAVPQLVAALREIIAYENDPDNRPVPGSYGAEVYERAAKALAAAGVKS